MKGRIRMGAALLAFLGTTGCSQLFARGTDGWSPPDGVTILAKADGWREALATDERFGGNYAVVEIAYDEATARAAWADNVPAGLAERDGEPREPGVYGALEDVDLAEQALVVYSSGQSGACPGWVESLSIDDGTLEITEGTFMPGNGCTDDYNPYRLVLAVDRDRLPADEDLPSDQVLVDGRELAAQVSDYPFT